MDGWLECIVPCMSPSFPVLCPPDRTFLISVHEMNYRSSTLHWFLTRGDIYRVLRPVIALITWLLLHIWTKSGVKLFSDEMTLWFSPRGEHVWTTVVDHPSITRVSFESIAQPTTIKKRLLGVRISCFFFFFFAALFTSPSKTPPSQNTWLKCWRGSVWICLPDWPFLRCT